MTTKPKHPGGRPTLYNEDIAGIICGRLAAGESLNRICRDDEMPSIVAVYSWLAKHEEFLKLYTRAREEQADTLADEITDIADEQPELDPLYDKDGQLIEMRMHSAYVTWQKNRVDARKWVAAKLKPRKYGEKLDVTSDGQKVGLGIHIDLGDK